MKERGTQVKRKGGMNKYLSIITLKVNGLNALIKRNGVTEWIRIHDPHICCLHESQLRTKDLHRQSERLEKNITNIWTGKKMRVSNTHIRPNRLQNKSHKKRSRRTLHNTQGKNPSGRHKHKHICTQHRSTHRYKENLGGLQERY